MTLEQKNSLKWTDKDREENQKLKQNFFSISYFNVKHELMFDLSKQYTSVSENITKVRNVKKQLASMENKEQKEDLEQKYTEYQIYLTRIQERIKAAIKYIETETIQVKGTISVKPKRKYNKRQVKKE